jgi:hypothetical protein
VRATWRGRIGTPSSKLVFMASAQLCARANTNAVTISAAIAYPGAMSGGSVAITDVTRMVP